jgi:hypothetical protein
LEFINILVLKGQWSYLPACNRTTKGQATKILEYVPTITPIIMANAKRFITAPPNNQSTRTTIKVVTEVIIVRLKESFIL